jgi:polyhydroxybutyrate depolymerase
MSILSPKADSAGFIVVYPEGTVINNNRTWNAGLCCPPVMYNNIDDVEFVDHLIDTLKQDYSIDSTRIYASGSSNGAMLCFRLACELSHKIAAIATISAAHEFFPCNPVNKVPIINFHSLVDSAVLYNGGVGIGPSGVCFISQDSTIRIWRDLNNCFSTDTIVNGGNTGYSFIKVHNCSCNAVFDHYVTSDGGHSWPGGNPNNNPVSYQISATYLLWEFFKNYTLGCLTGVHDHQNPKQGLKVYPNPIRENLIITNLNTEVKYAVMNTPGGLVCSGTTKGVIDLHALLPGVYILHLTKDSSSSTFKIVKE